MNQKIALITGAHGFIGRNSSMYYCNQGWKVIGVGHGNWSRPEWRKWGLDEWHSCDITLENLLFYGRNPGIVIHCAGSGSVGFSMSHPYQDYLRTVGTTLAVLEFIRLYSPSTRLVYPSSAAVYGNSGILPIGESAALQPISVYGVHKRIVEELISAYGKHYSILAAMVRLFSAYGPGLRKQILWDACEKIKRGEFNFFGTGEESRDWIHVEDVVSLLYRAGENATAECPIVNGGSGSELKVRDLLEEVFRWFNIYGNIKFSGKKSEGDPERYFADISNARKWNWEPRMEWRTGIREYVDWFKKGAL